MASSKRDCARNTAQGCCPLKLLEALAAGCPVVASDLPLVRELAAPGDHFVPCAPGDPRLFIRRVYYFFNRST